MKKTYSFFALMFLYSIGIQLSATTSNYYGTTGTLSGSVWSTPTDGGVYTSALNSIGGPILYFNHATTSITGGDISVSGINVNADVTIGTAGGTFTNFINVVPIDVSTGFTFDGGTQTITGSNTAGYTKNGGGVLAWSGAGFGGGFTLNAGTVVMRAANSMGNAALTINGGVLAATGNRVTMGKFTSFTIGGDFTFGATTGLAASSANILIDPATSLGNATRTITLGGTGDYTLGGVVSGNAAVGLTLNSTAAGTLILSGTNTYSGLTTVNSGATLKLNNTSALGTIAAGTIINSGAVLNLNGINYTTLEPLSIAGTGISSGGAIVNTIATAATFSGPITFTASATIIAGSGTITLNSATAISGTGDISLSGIIGGTISSKISLTGSLSTASTGVWTISGANDYSGTTSVNNGTLRLGASEVIPNGSLVTLNSSTLSTGATVGYTETAGQFDLNGNGTIALGTGSHTLTFADSHTQNWGNNTLTITGWDGTSAGRVSVGTSATGLSSTQLAKITFTGYSTGAQISASGEITPGSHTLIPDNSNNTVDYNLDISFTDDPTWRAAITSVSIDGTPLTPTTDYLLTAGNLQLIPSGNNTLLTNTSTSTSKVVTIDATGYSTATITQTITAGAVYKLGMRTEPTTPASNGTVLATQPKIWTQDRYGNNKSASVDVTATVAAGAWRIGGTTTVTSVTQTTTFTNLTANSDAAVTGATITFTSPGLVSVTSASFNIPVPISSPSLTAAIGATVDGAFDVTFTDVPAWRSAISSITVDGTTLAAGAYNTTVAGKITFTPSVSTLLQSNGNKAIVVYSTGYASASVIQAIAVGAVSASISTAAIDANLQGNTTRTITCTAKDQYSNLVSGYVFKYDATITNINVTTAESYTVDGNARTSTTNDLTLTATNGSGVASFNVTLPATIDSGDGLVIQIQLNNGSTNVGADFGNVLIAQTITFGALASKVNGEAAFALTGSATSGLTVTYLSSDTNVATVSGATVTILSAGSTTITALQLGDGSYSAATSVPQTLTVTATPNTTVANAQDLSISALITSATSDMTIQSGGRLTVNANKTVHDLTVDAGGKIVFSSSNTLTVSGNVVLKADKTTGSFSANIGSGALSITGTAKYLKTMDNSKWYFMSFPCDVAVNDITFTTGGPYTLGTDYFIKYYDGASRIENLGASTNWINVTSGQTLNAGKGYIIGLANSIVVDREMIFPLVKATVQSETTRYVGVNAYGDGVTTNVLGNTVGTNHKGWNLVGQPYLSKFTGAQIGANYVTLYDGTAYSTYANSDVATIDPFSSFFVQADATLASNSILYNTSGRQSVTSSVSNDSIDRVRLYFTTATGVDNTNLIIGDAQTSDYQIGQDMEKWITKSTSRPQFYSFLNGINYAFNALPIRNVQNLALGLYSNATTTATISSDAKGAPNLAELLLTDTSTGITTDLLKADYSFTADAGTNNSRFLISAKSIATANTIMNNEAVNFSMHHDNLLITKIDANTKVAVFDAWGHLKVNLISTGNSIEIPLQLKGVYLVQLTDCLRTVVRKVVCN